MRDELTLMELADRYLRGELNATDRAAFEERMRTNAELRELVEDQRALLGGMERLALRPAVNKAYRSHKLGKWAPGIGGAAVIAILALGGWMLAKDSGHSTEAASDASEEVEQLLTLSDTTGTGLPALVMMIDPKADTTLITPNGLVLDIPKGAFVDEAGHAITKPVRVTLLEAIDGVDIMKAGLSTMSGDTLLETGGMFYIDAQVDGKRVGVDPTRPLTVMVPSEQADPRMMLYEGVMTEEGVVDWRNPQPLPRTLVPVDISTLDFYPPGYLAKVAELGKDATDKEYTDSLYWSFSGEYARFSFQDEAAGADSTWTIPDTLTEAEFARRVEVSSPDHMKGAFLFAMNCSSCHRPERNLTGPALNGARQRWEGRGDIYAWIKNSSAYLKTGNSYANQLFNKWNKSIMTPHELSNAEIDQILKYVDMPNSATSGRMGIDPAKVQAIWNESFNGTNLATREFEERMLEIHRTCDNKVLDLYANNLGKNLSQLDSMAVRMGHGAFASFALRNDGRVDLPQHAAERLRKVYTDWSQKYAQAIQAAQHAMRMRERELDEQMRVRKGENEVSEQAARLAFFNEEVNANLRSVYEQLGYTVQPPRFNPSPIVGRRTGSNWNAQQPNQLPDRPATRGDGGGSSILPGEDSASQRAASLPSPPSQAFTVQIISPGWKNIDWAVAATGRQTNMTIQDVQTGRVASISYDQLNVGVSNNSSYDEVRAYLIPRSINSYQRMPAAEKGFRASLNISFVYDLVVLAQKDGQTWLHEEREVKANSVITASLEVIDDAALSVKLAEYDRTGKRGMSAVADHLKFMNEFTKRRMKQLGHASFRQQLLPVVFPCHTIQPDAESSEISNEPSIVDMEVETQVFTLVEQMPQFPGGEDALFKFLSERLRVPSELTKDATVYISFVVRPDGSITDIRVLQTGGSKVDAEAIRVIREMPTWFPGRQKGRTVPVVLQVPIEFRIR